MPIAILAALCISSLVLHSAATSGGIFSLLVPVLLLLIPGVAWIGNQPRTRRLPWGLALALALAVLAWWHYRIGAPPVVCFAPAIIYLMLLMNFGATLLPGREPLITFFARQQRSTLPADLLRYTRHVTWAWCIFFALMALATLLLAFFAPLSAWSLFANLLSYGLLAAMFILEYVYRRIRYPQHTHPPLLAHLRSVAHSMTIRHKS